MTTHTLRPWTDLVKLHPDVEAGALTEVVFAIDLGAIAANDPNVPVLHRDPEAFFRATYLTTDLQKLLEEVLASLSGKTGGSPARTSRVSSARPGCRSGAAPARCGSWARARDRGACSLTRGTLGP